MKIPVNYKIRNIARTPKQKRGIRTRWKIMKAGEGLFAEQGFHPTPVESIAEAAGVSTGSFYAYFNDKHELFLCLVDELLNRINGCLIDRFETIGQNPELTWGDFLHQTVRAIYEAHNLAPDMLGEIFRMSMLDDTVQARLNEVNAPVQTAIAAALRERLKWPESQRTDTAAYVIYHAVEGVIHRLVLHPGETREEVALEELTTMLAAYLADH